MLFFLFQILQCVPFIPNSAILFYQIVMQSIKCKSITKMKSNHYHYWPAFQISASASAQHRLTAHRVDQLHSSPQWQTFETAGGARALNAYCSGRKHWQSWCHAHVFTFSMAPCASHLSKTYLKAMKAKASGRVQTRSRGWGKTLLSSSVFRSRQCMPGGSQKSSLHSHSFNTASILPGVRGVRGRRWAWCWVH